MSSITAGGARAVADLAQREILATVEVTADPERVFRALASKDITGWWVRPGIFDTRDWTGELRAGGRWRASGMSRGQPYVQEGAFVEIDAPRRLVHTWDGAGTAEAPSVVSYLLEPAAGHTRITLRHSGFASPEVCGAFAIGWETSPERLAEILAAETSRRG
jgi:uncharacterized protein YndB with AHSA1/START domain